MGGKSLIAKQIINKFPINYNTYVEPFFGAGNVFFRIPNEKREKINVINDLDKDIYIIMKELQKRGKIIDKTLNREVLKNKEEFKKLIIKQDVENLIRKNKFSFFGIGKTYSILKNKRIKTNYAQFEDKLKDVIILNQSFEKVIDKYDSKETFFYLDPPYESKNSKQNYKDYIEPLQVYESIKNIKGKFLLSYNDSQNIRELFKNYKIEIIETRYTHTKQIEIRKINELLISNY